MDQEVEHIATLQIIEKYNHLSVTLLTFCTVILYSNTGHKNISIYFQGYLPIFLRTF